MVAALSGKFNNCLGIELVPGLHDIATKVCRRHAKASVKRKKQSKRVRAGRSRANNSASHPASIPRFGIKKPIIENTKTTGKVLRRGGGGGMLAKKEEEAPPKVREPTPCDVSFMCCSVLDPAAVALWST